MFEINGKYTKAKIFCDNIDNEALSQIISTCNQPYTHGSTVCIMPDVHKGSGSSVVGFTMRGVKKIDPNLLGSDIGCGMLVVRLPKQDIDFEKFDKAVKSVKYTPSGFGYRELKCFVKDRGCEDFDANKAGSSFCSIGGSNHFVELDEGEKHLYLVIHTGSRLLGKEILRQYQHIDMTGDWGENLEYARKQVVKDYAHDVRLACKWALQNRIAIATSILKDYYDIPNNERFRICLEGHVYTSDLWEHEFSGFDTVHNFITVQKDGSFIIRKGACDASKGKSLVIPLNMRDGALICKGKGNEDWNCSAPHGAGRLLSRGDAKEIISLEDLQNDMKGVYTTTLGSSTISEAPAAYKPAGGIINAIGDTVEIVEHVKTIYNYKE